MARRASADRGLLGGAPDPGLRTGRFELIGNPPLSERTGRRRWSAEVAKKLVGWKTEEVLVLVTAQEKVEAIRELARDDEAVAAQVATDFLRQPEVAFKAMRDPEARENVNEAQFEQAELEDDGSRRTGSRRTMTTPSVPARTGPGSTTRPASCMCCGPVSRGAMFPRRRWAVPA
ncbi:DUF6192 family protein [Streptomyces pristinaespiralis]|uniref:DUF6192 family protein n=1 Tax=Streptomyces pristinaespiralis TaxID=38300 RepID=UPI001F349E0E|nr:DUF6192 family protein [Streptomyces pristinaespiralis]